MILVNHFFVYLVRFLLLILYSIFMIFFIDKLVPAKYVYLQTAPT